MKKLLSLTALVTILLVALTGCVNVNYEVSLNKDGSADVSYVFGYEKQALQQMGSTGDAATSGMRGTAEESEYKIEAYSDDKIEGFKASKHFDNASETSLENVFGSSYVKDSQENQLKIEKNSSKTKYSQNAKIDLSGIPSSMVTMKYTVKLPVKAGENNADEVSKDGKTLTWNLKAGEINTINFTAVSGNTTGLVVIIVLAIIVAFCILFIVLSKTMKKEPNVVEIKKDSKEDDSITPVKKEEVRKSEEPKSEVKPVAKKKTATTTVKKTTTTSKKASTGTAKKTTTAKTATAAKKPATAKKTTAAKKTTTTKKSATSTAKKPTAAKKTTTTAKKTSSTGTARKTTTTRKTTKK